ncbi:MAG: rod shape-determining protein MreC [Clostridiales bacterium]|nr:rod shape-determining protein MreC [Clostridiales bacterium]
MRRRIRIQPWWVLGTALVLLFVVLIITYSAMGSDKPTVADTVIGESVSPFMRWTHSVTSGVKDFFARIFGKRDIDREYEELKKRVAQLELEKEWAQELIHENKRLTELMGFARQYPQYLYMNAEVIARDPESWYSTLTINRGEKDGISLNMPIVTADGLLGRIISVSETYSVVMPLVDRQSAVAAVLERSRDNGVLKGATDQDSSDPLCNLYYLPFSADLIPGDRVLSSGMGGYYPKGIPIGEIVEVSRQSNLQSYAIVRPYVDFAHAEDVLVIIGEAPVETPGAPTSGPDEHGGDNADEEGEGDTQDEGDTQGEGDAQGEGDTEGEGDAT